MDDLIVLQFAAPGTQPTVRLVTEDGPVPIRLRDNIHGAGDHERDGVLTAVIPRNQGNVLEVDNHGYPVSPDAWMMSFAYVEGHWQPSSLVGEPPDQPRTPSWLDPSLGWACFAALALMIVTTVRGRRRHRSRS